MNPVLHSSASAHWRTPAYFLELVRQVGPIAYDPASQPRNPTVARVFSFETPKGVRFTAEDPPGQAERGAGGLDQDWEDVAEGGLVYCNPPYGSHLPGPVNPKAKIFRKVNGEPVLVGIGTGWAAKMAQNVGEGLYLVPARVETGWFRRLHRWADWRLDWSSPTLGARIRFEDGSGARSGAPFPSSVFYRGPNVGRFMAAFKDHGTLVPGARTLDVLLRAGLRGV